MLAGFARTDRHNETLTDRQRTALELADVVMTQPGAVSEDLRRRLHEHFSSEQIIELTLDVMKWNYQKVMVALGTDLEVSPGELADLIFDTDGHWVPPT